MKKLFSTSLFTLALLATSATSFAATKYISIGTGAITGVYYPAGGGDAWCLWKVGIGLYLRTAHIRPGLTCELRM